MFIYNQSIEISKSYIKVESLCNEASVPFKKLSLEFPYLVYPFGNVYINNRI